MMSLFNERYTEDPMVGIRVFRNFWDRQQQEEAVRQAREVKQAAPFFSPEMWSGQAFKQRLTNCGLWGWVAGDSEFVGNRFPADGEYRYQTLHPRNGQPWPQIPGDWQDAAIKLAAEVGSPLIPQSCLINYYPRPDGSLGMHVDQTEEDRTSPIVTISLGDSCYFRVSHEKTGGTRILLHSGDVVVMHGRGRSAYHGVTKIIADSDLLSTGGRLSLTLRKVKL